MVYTASSLVADCAASKGRLKLAGPGRAQTYSEVWQCVCRWITDQYEQAKGVNIPSLCRIGWQIVPASGGSSGYRVMPFFHLSDHFCRSHGLPVRKRPAAQAVTPIGDINFIKLAIKFSNNLTKDVVFSASRDLFQRLGQVMASGAIVSVDMGVGKLNCKDRKSMFVFDAAMREAVSAKHPVDSSMMGELSTGGPASATGRRATPVVEVAYRAPSEPAAAAHTQYVTQPAYAAAPAQPEPQHEPAPEVPALDFTQQAGAGGAAVGAGPAAAAAAAAGPAYDGPPSSQGSLPFWEAEVSAQDQVLEDALSRHEQRMLAQAEAEAAEEEECEEAMWQAELELRQKRRAEAEEKKRLQEYIKHQIKEAQTKKAIERKDQRSLEPTHTIKEYSAPVIRAPSPSSTRTPVVHHNGAIISGPTMYDMDGIMQHSAQAREELNQALREQIEFREARERAEKARQLEQEKRYLEFVRQEDEEHRAVQKAQAEIRKRQLMQHWARDKQFKDKLKAVKTKRRGGASSNRSTLSASGSAAVLGLGALPAAAGGAASSRRGFTSSSGRLPPAGGGGYSYRPM